MKQPFEDIPIVSRKQDDLLSLEDAALPRRAMMMALAKHLERATMVGNPAPIVTRMYERMHSPQIGDLVVETSTVFGRGGIDAQVTGFGILIERRREWWSTDAEWEAKLVEDPELHEEGEERPTEQAWYVLYGPGPENICRWVNCSFIAIPTEPRMFDIPLGTTDADGVTITRADLIEGLSDSGFRVQPFQ